ncbi:MAG: YqaA family protein [Bryobacteraceae bacterium]
MSGFRATLVAWGPLGILVLSIVESVGIPNPGGTDWLLLIVTVSRPDAWPLCAALATVGSLIGSLVFYEIMRKGGEKFLYRYTLSGRGARFRIWFQRYGMVSVFIAALLPIPFLPLKALAACGCAIGVSRARFLGVILLARIPRYGALAYLGAQLGESSAAWLKGHTWHMAALAAALFVTLYGLLKLFDRVRVVKNPG